jgi:TolB-like protein
MSILPGFEYDIFISYRHNDNRSGWVTEFVKALHEELAATIKEPVSVYFDSNPHDGLLETHNVDKSLEGKLKCLIFIPIISQTYCDPKAFAWQHEFVAFNKLAQEDELGRDIKLSNGNVASRILPIKIHKLDKLDHQTIEQELVGPLRAIEFIFAEAGVNRPLKLKDLRKENQLNIDYEGQLNKLANAVKEFIYAFKGLSLSYAKVPNNDIQPDNDGKAIIVLPFVNISNDEEQEYFSDGLTEELITELSKLNSLLVISRSSAMTFKNSSKKIKEIAGEVKVRYVLEGSVRKAGNNLRITAQLIDAKTDTHLWADNFNGVLEDVFDIQEKVSRAIVKELEVKISNYESEVFTQRPINSGVAFDYYLRARRELLGWNEAAFRRALKLLQNALDIVGPNAVLYAGMAYVYWNFGNIGLKPEESSNLTEEYIKKARTIDPESPEANLVLGLVSQSFHGQPKLANQHFRKVLKWKPNDFDAIMWIFVSYFTFGKVDKAIQLSRKMVQIDPLAAISLCSPGIIEMYRGNYDDSLPYLVKACQMEPENTFFSLFYSMALACSGQENTALDFIRQNPLRSQQGSMGQTFVLFERILEKDRDINDYLTPEIELYKRDFQLSHILAQMFSLGGMKEQTYEWLESAISRGFCNYPLLSNRDPINKLLKGEARFESLLTKMKVMWDEFE